MNNPPTANRATRTIRNWLLPGEFPATTLLLILNGCVFAMLGYQSQSFYSLDSSVLFRAGANIGPYTLYAQEPWRLLTYNVLHADLLHLAVNSYGMWQLGRILEKRMGTGRLMVVYLFSGLGGGLLSAQLGLGVSVGASGALYGWLAALGVYAHYAGLKQLRNRVMVAGASMYVIAFALGGTNIRFDNWAHTGGAIVGAAFALAFVQHEKRLRRALNRRNTLFAIVGTLAFLILVATPFAVQYHFRDVPPAPRSDEMQVRAVQRLTWQRCRDALGTEPSAEAIAPCREFRLATWESSMGYLLLHTLYGALEMDGRVAQEERLYDALFEDSLSDDLLPPADFLPLLVNQIDDIIYERETDD